MIILLFPFELIGVVAPCTIPLSNNGCTNCKEGYYLNNYECSKCNENCTLCSLSTQCSKCKKDFVLTSQNQCLHYSY